MKVKDLVFPLSLANLCLFKIYSQLFSICDKASNHYFVKALPSRIDFLAFILNLLILGFSLWISIRIARRFSHHLISKIINYGLASLLIIPIYWILRMERVIPSGLLGKTKILFLSFSSTFSPVILSGSAILIICLIIAAGFLLIRWRHIILKVGFTIIFLLSPFVLVTLTLTSLQLSTNPGSNLFLDKFPLASLQKKNPSNVRIVILLFDELDFRLTFPERLSILSLPEMDNLRKQALFASNSYPPANSTSASIPALITGKALSKVEPIRADELMIVFDGDKEGKKWSSVPNIFSEAKDLGYDSGLVGCYHPYSRVLGENLKDCIWYEGPNLSNMTGDALFEKIINQLRSLIETPTLSFFGQTLTLKKSISTYQNHLRDAMQMVGRDDLPLIFIHFPIPHLPGIYDLAKRDFSLANTQYSGYIGNLALMDRTLGEVRDVMEKRGTWDRSTVILTSDHYWRQSERFDGKKDNRVPFLVKLAGQRESVNYQPIFNTVILHDLILALLRKEITNPRGLAEWMNGNGKAFMPSEIPGFLD